MKYICIIVLCIICIPIFPQRWISLNDKHDFQTITTEIKESSDTKYFVDIEINGIFDSEIDTNNGIFHQLSLSDGGALPFIGEPALPTIQQLIAIPDNCNYSVSIHEINWKTINTEKIIPSQPPYNHFKKDKLIINEKVYDDIYEPNILTIGEKMVWRNINNIVLSICPFKYNCKKNELFVLNRFSIEVAFEKQEGKGTEFSNPTSINVFDNILSYDDNCHIDYMINGNKTDYYDYLIIVGKNTGVYNSSILQEFLKWKAFKGLRTKAVSTEMIGSSYSEIKNYIKQEYKKGIRYVLFVGDDNHIPLYGILGLYQQDRYIYGDYYYGCMPDSTGNQTDLQADIAIGRFPVNSLSEFRNMVNKTIKYESEYHSTNHILLMAHYQYYPDSYQNCCQIIMTTTYSEPTSFINCYGAPLIYGGNNATNTQVINYINQGAHIINYRGHGSVNYWGDPYWNNAQESFPSTLIDSLSRETNAIFFSIACHTGNIINQECMLETFLRANHGAVAFIASTYNVETDTNSGYNQCLFKKLLNDKVYNLGDLNILSHFKNFSAYTLLPVDVALSYLCGGDPSLEIWTGTPQHIGGVGINFLYDSLILECDLIDGYYVSVVSENGELLNRVNTNTAYCSFDRPSQNCYIVINRHNYFPYILYYDTESHNIQNTTFEKDILYVATPLHIGENLTNDIDYGKVIVPNGRKVFIKKGNGVLISGGFECKQGGLIDIK